LTGFFKKVGSVPGHWGVRGMAMMNMAMVCIYNMHCIIRLIAKFY
jgi:hypothetical protein